MPVCQLRSRDHGTIFAQVFRLVVVDPLSLCDRTHTRHAILKKALDRTSITAGRRLEPHTVPRIVKEMEHVWATRVG
jgi:hypothetical protein